VGDPASEADLMRDQQHRLAGHSEIRDHREHFVRQPRVERRGRLVEQQHIGLHRQRPGNRHPLLLSARERVRKGLRITFEPDARQQGFGAGARRGRGETEDPARGLLDIARRAQVGKQMKALEHHADAQAHRAQRRRVAALAHPRVEPVTGDLHLPFGERRQIVERAQQRALTPARWPNQCHHLAAADAEIDPAQHFRAAQAGAQLPYRQDGGFAHVGTGTRRRSSERARRDNG